MRIGPAASALAALWLGGCAMFAQEESPGLTLPPAGADSCNAAARQGLVGQKIDVVATLDLDQPVRVIPPSGVVTMDFLAERINFEIDGSERIVRVSCG